MGKCKPGHTFTFFLNFKEMVENSLFYTSLTFTQVLTDHGLFGEYLKEFDKSTNCINCRVGSVSHTINESRKKGNSSLSSFANLRKMKNRNTK